MASRAIQRAAVVTPAEAGGYRWLDRLIAFQIVLWLLVVIFFLSRADTNVVASRIRQGYGVPSAMLATAASMAAEEPPVPPPAQ